MPDQLSSKGQNHDESYRNVVWCRHQNKARLKFKNSTIIHNKLKTPFCVPETGKHRREELLLFVDNDAMGVFNESGRSRLNVICILWSFFFKFLFVV